MNKEANGYDFIKKKGGGGSTLKLQHESTSTYQNNSMLSPSASAYTLGMHII